MLPDPEVSAPAAGTSLASAARDKYPFIMISTEKSSMRRGVIGALLLLCSATAARAQDSTRSVAPPGVKPGHTVRLAVPGQGRVVGDVERMGSDGLTLGTASGPRTFAVLPDTLWTRERSVKQGAIAGGIAGVAGGIFLGVIANALCEYDCGSSAGYAAAGGLLVGVGGAALGSLVGAAIPRWKRRTP